MDEWERFQRALWHEPIDRPPVICPMQSGTIDLMKASGAYWPKAHHFSRLMADLALAAHKFTGLESVRVPFEHTVDVSAFGAATSDWRLGRAPQVLERKVAGLDDFAEIEVPDPEKDGKVPVVLDAIRLLQDDAPRLPILLGMESPHMLAFELLGDQHAQRINHEMPVLLRAVLHKALAWTVAYATAAVDAGTDAIVLVDCLSSGDFLTTDEYEEWALPFQRLACAEIEKLGVPAILHVCGNSTRNLHMMTRAEPEGISIDHAVDVVEARRIVQSDSV
ncbi:MAG: uroporphyrinogen decarboxylase family protein, partial [Candidatus Saccharibacteria bacterium]